MEDTPVRYAIWLKDKGHYFKHENGRVLTWETMEDATCVLEHYDFQFAYVCEAPKEEK